MPRKTANPIRLSTRLLRIEQILEWAQEHHARTGVWPGPRTPGIIPGTACEKWKNIYESLRAGHRGLPGGSSLAKLLAERLGAQNHLPRPPLTIRQVLLWADDFHATTGKWPSVYSGQIPGTQGETWSSVARALETAGRGLPVRCSLPSFLAEHRGRRNQACLPPLTQTQILAWADEHYQRTRQWPDKRTRAAIAAAPGESWTNIDAALRTGKRGLPPGSSLARLLAQARHKRNRAALPPLTEEKILHWADIYYRRHGRWPTEPDGLIPRSGGETWSGVDQALRVGLRGLPPGSSLPRLLARVRAYINRSNRPRLSFARVLAWADAHHARTGKWPTSDSGVVTDAPDERWDTIDAYLRRGGRGLPGGTSLICLLMEARGAKHPHHPDRVNRSAQVDVDRRAWRLQHENARRRPAMPFRHPSGRVPH
jgi:hypothetical protein